jgi:membrane-bound lytic murein transglycosylase B
MTRLIAVGLLSLAATFASAQTRVNDKDIAAMMNNLKSDTNLFRSAFNTSVKKSTIRKTSKEKDSKALVQSFDNQVQAMQRTFKEKKAADAQVSIDDRTNTIWAKVKTELNQLATAYGVPPIN